MRRLPLVRGHRPGAHLNDQIADRKPRVCGHGHEIDVRPSGTVVVHHVRDLRQQQTFRFQDPLRLFEERRIQVAQGPPVFLAALHRRAEIHVEALPALVAPLRADVWGIEDDDTESVVLYPFHDPVVADDHGLVAGVYIHRYDAAGRPFPESPGIECRIQDRLNRD